MVLNVKDEELDVVAKIRNGKILLGGRIRAGFGVSPILLGTGNVGLTRVRQYSQV